MTHAVRQRHYSQKYIEIFKAKGNEKASKSASYIDDNKEIKACLEMAVYLCRSGRTNEKSGQEDPSNARRSAALFSKVAQELKFDKGLIDYLEFAIATHAPDLNQPKFQNLIDKLPGEPEQKLALAEMLKGIIDLSHHTDLVRCKTGSSKQPVSGQMEKELSHFINSDKADPKLIAQNMLLHAADACALTGTRIKYQEFSAKSPQNNSELKVKHTQDVSACIKELGEISLNIDKNVSLDNLLEKAQKDHVLDLSSRTLTNYELKEVKNFISNNELTSVRLIGMQPEDFIKEIESVCPKGVDVRTIDTQKGSVIDSLNQQFRQHAINEQKTSMKFEPSRIGTALSKGLGALFSQFGKEIKGDIPKFGGEQHFTELSNVKTLRNQTLEGKYQELRHDVAPLPTQLIDSLSTIDMPGINLQPGEMLLYHGVSQEVAPLIMNHGFDENRCKNVSGNGYGPLGKGVYFTNELSKAGTFASCSMCQQSGQCDCMDPDTGEQPDRVLLLCKVFVGNPEIILRKGDIKDRTEPTKGYDSCISLSNNIDPISGFRSTEICIPKGAQAVPLFALNFSSQPSLINTKTLTDKMARCNLSKNKDTKKLANGIIKDVTQLIKARDKGVPFSTIQEKSDGLLQKVSTIENILKGKQPDLPKNHHSSKEIRIQMHSLTQLKSQLTALKKDDIRPVKKKENIKRNPKLMEKIKSILTSKEKTLKKQLYADFNRLGRNKISDSTNYIDQTLNVLNTAIERDCSKGNHLFAKKEYPAHRAILTNAMVRLRSELLSLKEKPLPNEQKAKKVEQITAEIFDMATVNNKEAKKVKSSTNYKLLYHLKGLAGKMSGEINSPQSPPILPINQGTEYSTEAEISHTSRLSENTGLSSSKKTSSTTPSDSISNASWHSEIAMQKEKRALSSTGTEPEKKESHAPPSDTKAYGSVHGP